MGQCNCIITCCTYRCAFVTQTIKGSLPFDWHLFISNFSLTKANNIFPTIAGTLELYSVFETTNKGILNELFIKNGTDISASV